MARKAASIGWKEGDTFAYKGTRKDIKKNTVLTLMKDDGTLHPHYIDDEGKVWRIASDDLKPLSVAPVDIKPTEPTKHEDLVHNLFKTTGFDVAKEAAIHAAIGCCGEAGELLDAVKKGWAYGKPLDRENIIEELGDLEFYMEALRQQLFISREETLTHNIAKLLKRYPTGQYTNEDAIARADKNG